jgi:hypothetical protein
MIESGCAEHGHRGPHALLLWLQVLYRVVDLRGGLATGSSSLRHVEAVVVRASNHDCF